MNHLPNSVSYSRRWRRWLLPATSAGAGGTALVIWFEELIALAAEFISVIILLALSVPIFLFNHLVFKSAMPRPDDKREK